MKKFWNWVKDEDTEIRTLHFNGAIAEESWFDDEITPRAFKAEVESAIGDVIIWLNSPGGDCIAASQIYSMLMNYKGNITVKIDGIAASAASVIAMAGTKVLMAPTALMMIHNPLTVAIRDSKEMQKAIDMLSEVKESIINAYEVKTSLSRTKLSHLMDAETWMNANKAIELGFADEILDDEKKHKQSDNVTYAFSRKAVTNSLLDKVAVKKDAQTNNNKLTIETLKERLKLIQGEFEYEQLYEKRNKAVADARTFLDSKRSEGDILSEEDNAIYAKMENSIMALTREIERESRLTAIDAEMSKPKSNPLLNTPSKMQTNEKPKTGIATAEYKDSMLNALHSNFRRVNNVLQEGVDSDGGYLVPTEYDTRLIEGLTEENIIRKLATTIKTGAERKINIGASTPAAAWIDEGGALTFGDAKFEQINLDAHKLHVAVKVTEELLYDNVFNLENYILNKFAKALANAEEDAFLNGAGRGKPLGIFAATGGGQIGVTTASATAITADEIINLIYSLKRPYRKNAVFMTNDQTLSILRKLKDANGAYIWQRSYQVGEPDSLLGYPVYTSAYVPTVNAGNPVIAFGDFSYYNIGDRGSRSFAELKELFAGNGMVGFVAKERVDGRLVLPEAVQILKIKDKA